jgi:hypothetical protein
MRIDSELDIAAMRSYERVRERVAVGELRLLLLLSPPRTGSTVLANALAQRGHVDALLTEPAAQYRLSSDRRVSEAFQLIADAAEAVAPRSAPGRPAVMLVKEISQHIGPDREWRAWRGLFEKTLILVRRPVLALESLVLMTLGLADLLSGGAAARPPLWLSATALAAWPPDAVASWDGFLAHLRQTRDFRDLDDDRLRDYWYESPMFGMSSLQIDVWANEARHGRVQRLPDDVHRHVGTPASAITTLPADLRRPFVDRHFGWSALHDLWENTARDDTSLALVDFASVQAAPGTQLDAIAEFYALAPRPLGAEAPIQRSGYDTHDESFIQLMFGEARAGTTIAPTLRSPLSSERFSAFLQTQLRDADPVYDRMTRDPRRL